MKLLKRIRDFLVAALICWPQPFGFFAIGYIVAQYFPEPTPVQIGVGFFLAYFMFIFSVLWATIPVLMLLIGPERTLRSIKEDILPQFRFTDPERTATSQKSGLVRWGRKSG